MMRRRVATGIQCRQFSAVAAPGADEFPEPDDTWLMQKEVFGGATQFGGLLLLCIKLQFWNAESVACIPSGHVSAFRVSWAFGLISLPFINYDIVNGQVCPST